MHPDEIAEVFRMDKKKLPITEYRGDDKKAGCFKQKKWHLRMEESTEAINSSSDCRIFAMQWNRDKDKRESGKGTITKV